MAISYRDIFDVNLKYLEYVVSKTLVIHQLLHNVAVTGSGVEVEVRELLRRVIPSRFRVTHGYIVSASGRTTKPAVSPQVDMIVVDTLVPHSLWTVDETQGIEVVPLEAVVAIIEIKRSLTRDALAEAVEHLTTIRDRVQVRKDLTTRFLPGGVEVGAALSSPYRSNPLLGVVGILAGSWFSEQPRERFVELLNQATNQEDAARLELDMVLSLDGTLVATGDLNAGGNYQAHNVRTSSTTYPIRESSARTGNAPRQALAFGVGFLLSYLDKSCGRMSDIEGYFFNDNLVG